VTDLAARPVRESDPAGPRTQHAALAVLATSAFVYVSAEALPVGLLPEIAGGLSVTEAQVGLLLTSYAAVAALATIPLTAVTMRVGRHRLMAATVAVFTISQLVAAVAPTFAVLTVSRLLCALAHGVFWSAIAPIAARLAPPGQAGRATALVFLGNSLALVLGVPLGTLIGQTFGWRVAIASFGVAGALSLVALLVVLPPVEALPQDLALRTGQRLRAAVAIVRNPAIAPVCVVTTLLVVGQFAAYTYVAPLVRRSGLEGAGLSALLLGYGAAGVVGTVLAGRAVDRRPGPVLVAAIGVITLALAVLAFTPAPFLVVAAVLLWGAGFTTVPVPLQAAVLRVVPQAADAGSAVYVVAFQIGIGGGALLGERLYAAGHLDLLPVLGAGLALLSAVVVLAARGTYPSRVRPAPMGPAAT
jgi:predicted MFS family arabinose efflux permease